MSFRPIRARIESHVEAAFKPLKLRCLFDNTFETPPPAPYAVILISFPETTASVINHLEGAIEMIRGSLQISIYAARGEGMGSLEEYGALAMKAINTMYDWGAEVRVKCGQIQGPTPVLASTDGHALITLSCPFTASVGVSE